MVDPDLSPAEPEPAHSQAVIILPMNDTDRAADAQTKAGTLDAIRRSRELIEYCEPLQPTSDDKIAP